MNITVIIVWLTLCALGCGGMAHTGKGDILDINTSELHQRCPVYMGSKKMVQNVVDMIANKEIA